MKHFISSTPDQINEKRWVGHMAHPAKKNTHILQVGKHTGRITYRTLAQMGIY